MSKLVLASDCKCIKCGKQAVAFWPIIDPDIPHNPYCRKCLDTTRDKVIYEIIQDNDTPKEENK